MSIDRTKLLKAAGYSAFFTIAFVVMLYFTFPYSIVTERLQALATANHYSLTVGSLKPGLTGLTAERVSILFPPKAPGTAEEPTPLTLSSVRIRPALFPPGLAYSIKTGGGTIDGNYGLLGQPRITANAKSLDLTGANLKPLTGLDLSGQVNLVADVTLNKQSATKATGKIALNGGNLALMGGRVSVYDLPQIGLGKLESNLQIGAGKVNVSAFHLSGGDVEATVEGNMDLAERLVMSPLHLKLKFKASDEFAQKAPPIVKAGLGFLSKDAQGNATIAIERALGSPSFSPVRQ